jgi:hypothetical protein
MLRWSARSLWASPLLIALRLSRAAVGDAAVVIFVGLVLLFFLLLNVYIVFSLVDYRLGESVRWLRPYEGGRDALGLLARKQPVPIRSGGRDTARAGQTIEVRGRVSALAKAGPELVIDLWGLQASPPFRLTETVDLVVAAEGQIPIVVRWKAAPIVIARPRSEALIRGPLGAPARQLLEAHEGTSVSDEPGAAAELGQRVERLVVPDGAEVVLVGRVAAAIDDLSAFMALEAKADEDPYRPTLRRGLLVESTFEAPAVIQVL